MNWQKLARKLDGLQTVKSVAEKLDIQRNTAINYIYELRKRGYIQEESRGKDKIRLYTIAPYKKRKTGEPGLYEYLNQNSPVKLVEPVRHRLHGEKLTPEKALVRALETEDSRVILSSLALFRKVEDWYELYNLSKEKKIGRKVGALYDLARKTVSKVRRMDEKVRKMLKRTEVDSRYIVPRMRSDDFQKIEKEWNVFLPFNKGDLEVYKR